MAKKGRKIPGHIIVVAACTNAGGDSDFSVVAVRATARQIKDGDHFDTAEEMLTNDDYESPFVMWDEDNCPSWIMEGALKTCGVKDISELAEEAEDEEDESDSEESFDDEDLEDEEEDEELEEEDEED